MENGCESNDSKKGTASVPAAAAAAAAYGLDSDDEKLKFEEDDDLYASDADEADAKWVRKQHLPSAGCEEDGDGENIDRVEDDGDNSSNVAEGGRAAGIEEGDAPPTPVEKKSKKRGLSGTKGAEVVSDAQLSCPLCFTTVCLECQRHARYHTQFRAVHAMNVVVRDDETLSMSDISGQRIKRPSKQTKSGARRNQHPFSRPSDAPRGKSRQGKEEIFHPVYCKECDHRVGVMDEEEVFHFFGVIASG